MKIIKTKIKDLLIFKQKNNIDLRGSLRETYNKKLLNKNFVFEYCTTSKANALRGFHFQHKFLTQNYSNQGFLIIFAIGHFLLLINFRQKII